MAWYGWGSAGDWTTGYTDTYVYSDNVGIPWGRETANGQHPIIVTHLEGWVRGRGASRGGQMKMEYNGGGGLYGDTDWFSVGSAGSAAPTGHIGGVNAGFQNGGHFRFVIDMDGSFYFGRGGSGETWDGYGRNGGNRTQGGWNNGLGGAMSYVEAPTPPGTPSTSVNTSAPGRLNLSWSGPGSDGGTGVNGYRVYWHTNVNEINAGRAQGSYDVGGTSATFDGTPGTTYYFRIAAKNWVTDWAGTTSHWSGTGTGTPPGHPDRPRDFIALANNSVAGRIDLNWNPPSPTNGTITGYDIFRDGTKIVSTTGTGTSYSNIGLTPGTVYTYTVYARNAYSDANGARGPASVNASAMAPGVPSAPRNLTATASGSVPGRITLAWDKPTSEAGTVNAYRIYRDNVYIETVGVTSTGGTYTASGLTIGQSYTFKVTAQNSWSQGAGVWSADSNAATATAPGLSTAPRNLTATAATNEFGRINLSWTAPATPNGTIEYYKVYRDGAYIGLTNGATTFSATGLNHLQTYSFTVTARNSFAVDTNSESVASNAATAVSPGPPTAPRNLSGVGSAVNPGQMTLTWTAPSNTAGGITRYSVYQTNGTFVKDVAGNTTTTVVTGVPGTDYAYIVRAWNATADTVGTPSAPSNSTTVSALGDPAPPGALAVQPSATVSGRLILTWTSPGGGVTAYSVFRNSPTGTPIAIVKGLQFFDDGLDPAVEYTYYVRARNPVTDAAGTVGGDPAGPATGRPSSTSDQVVANAPVTNATNAALSGTKTITEVVLGFIEYDTTLPPMGSASVGVGSVVNNTNQTLNGTATITVPNANTVAFTRTIGNIPARTAVSSGSTVNNTNQTLNGPHQLTGAEGVTGKIAWADNQYDIAETASGGEVTNTTNTKYNTEDSVITAVTEDSFSYARPGVADQPLSSASGTATDLTNRDYYNGDQIVKESLAYNLLTYLIDGADSSDDLPSRAVGAPHGGVSRINSLADLEIFYRSGWAG